eukprot:scaffold174947_cov43-Prasinocladus_malaysianus.AAC.1
MDLGSRPKKASWESPGEDAMIKGAAIKALARSLTPDEPLDAETSATLCLNAVVIQLLGGLDRSTHQSVDYVQAGGLHTMAANLFLFLAKALSNDTTRFDAQDGGVNAKICIVCDLALMLVRGEQLNCGAQEKLRSLPPFPAKVPLPKALYQRVDRSATIGHGAIGSHLPRGWKGPDAIPLQMSQPKRTAKRAVPQPATVPPGLAHHAHPASKKAVYVLPDVEEQEEVQDGEVENTLTGQVKSCSVAQRGDTLRDIPLAAVCLDAY